MDLTKMEGIFTVKSKSVTVQYDTEHETLTIDHGKKKTLIPASDIYAVTSEGNTWTVKYACKRPSCWLPSNVKFHADDSEICQEWVHFLEETLSDTGKQRPKKLLVFINPSSGSKQGVIEYNKFSQPLFVSAGIEDDVIIMEDAQHADRVLENYDLDGIDGIITVGGDGTFMHVTTALIKRLMKDAGQDPDDPEAPLVQTDLCVGILPAGTGQGILTMLTGVMLVDYTTVTLQIILGLTVPGKLAALHYGKKLLCYSSLQCCFGILGHVIEKAESRRQMGRFRYLYSLLGQMFGSFNQPHEVTFHALVKGENGEEWIKKTGKFTDVCVFGANWFEGKISYVSDTLTSFIMDETAGRMTYVRFLLSYAGHSNSFLEDSSVTRYNLKAFKIEIPDPDDPNHDYHVLNIDGEPVIINGGLVQGRMHSDVFKVYGALCADLD